MNCLKLCPQLYVPLLAFSRVISSVFMQLYMSSSADTDTICLDGRVTPKLSDDHKSRNPLFSTSLNGSKSLHNHSDIRRPNMKRSSFLCSVDWLDDALIPNFPFVDMKISVNFFCLASSLCVLTSMPCSCNKCLDKPVVLVPLL